MSCVLLVYDDKLSTLRATLHHFKTRMQHTNDIETLFRAHYPAMYRLAMLILRDNEVSRDIVHDVFESLLTSNLATVSEAYLLKAVRNRCLNHIRNLSARDRLNKLYAVDEQEIDDEEWPDDETLARINITVAKDLTENCRRVVNLRFAEGKSYKEIADFLSISEVAVYKHLRHAIDVLRQKLS